MGLARGLLSGHHKPVKNIELQDGFLTGSAPKSVKDGKIRTKKVKVDLFKSKK